MPGSQPPVAYPGMPFATYPMMATAPYTAAQHQVPGAPPPAMYGYPTYYQYSGWGYPMPTIAQPGQMLAASPVQTATNSNGGDADETEESSMELPSPGGAPNASTGHNTLETV
jgi:hypothetical protein